MKILIITQYFWPENFRVNDLSLALKKRGHSVSVLTGIPNYPQGKYYDKYKFYNKKIEFWNNIKIYRSFLFPRGKGGGIRLILNYLTFALFASIKLFFIKEKFDKVIVYQLSPATVGIPGVIAKKIFNSSLIFYIQDLWPESLKDAGGINSKFIFTIIDKLMNYFYHKSNLILVQSEEFIEFLIKKGVNKSKIKYLPNTVENFYKPVNILEKYSSKFPDGFNILFAGNIGVAQDFNTIIKSAKILHKKKYNINWVILGDGREKKNIIKNIHLNNLDSRFYFLGSFPSKEMPYFFSCADLLLISLKKSSVFSITIPSKLQSYLACKKPLIGNVDGVASKIINKSGAGLSSESGDCLSLANNIEIMFKNEKSQMNNYSNSGFTYFKENFDRKIVYSNLEYFLNSI